METGEACNEQYTNIIIEISRGGIAYGLHLPVLAGLRSPVSTVPPLELFGGLNVNIETSVEKIKQLIAESWKRKMDCILCGKVADCRGVWIPTSEWSQKLGSMPDKSRVIVYPVCIRHVLDEATSDRIDEIIMSELMKNPTLPNHGN